MASRRSESLTCPHLPECSASSRCPHVGHILNRLNPTAGSSPTRASCGTRRSCSRAFSAASPRRTRPTKEVRRLLLHARERCGPHYICARCHGRQRVVLCQCAALLSKSLTLGLPTTGHQAKTEAGEAADEIDQLKNFGLLEDVERLKRDVSTLMTELGHMTEQRQHAEIESKTLASRVHDLELQQNRLLNFLAKALSNPSLLVQMLRQTYDQHTPDDPNTQRPSLANPSPTSTCLDDSTPPDSPSTETDLAALGNRKKRRMPSEEAREETQSIADILPAQQSALNSDVKLEPTCSEVEYPQSLPISKPSRAQLCLQVHSTQKLLEVLKAVEGLEELTPPPNQNSEKTINASQPVLKPDSLKSDGQPMPFTALRSGDCNSTHMHETELACSAVSDFSFSGTSVACPMEVLVNGKLNGLMLNCVAFHQQVAPYSLSGLLHAGNETAFERGCAMVVENAKYTKDCDWHEFWKEDNNDAVDICSDGEMIVSDDDGVQVLPSPSPLE
eukprot:scaffold7243_cov394-Prasinococcus_capsulatus_cf.AAC.28